VTGGTPGRAEVGAEVGVVTPFWLDRPDTEAVDIAVTADRAGFGTMWIGEMATFDAFALATAVGAATEGIRLRIGPLAAGVRGPVAVALGLSSVATLTGREVDIALGALPFEERTVARASKGKIRETSSAARRRLQLGPYYR